MDTEKQSAPARAPAKDNAQLKSTTRRPTGKAERTLRHFATGARLHRFQAERLGEHCLPTTVPRLQKVHPIYFQRKTETVPTNFGAPSHVSVYWLEGECLARAKEIVFRNRQGGR